MRSTIILHSDLLVDGQHLASQTPQALGAVMAGVFGGQAITWEKAYREICADWDSYWADLDLNADNSLEQWREGRWRIVRAHFRLAGFPLPHNSTISLHLDKLPFDTGQRCHATRQNAAILLQDLHHAGHRFAIITPYLPASLISGMIDSLSQSVTVDAVAGPDELWRAGLNGLSIAWLAQLAGAGSQNIIFAGNFMPDENATVLHTNAPDSLREKLTEARLLI